MWSYISNIGDAAITIPAMVAILGWLAASDRKLAIRCLIVLVIGLSLVGLTKFLYAGCGIEDKQIGFRVISGHTTLSTATWTIAIWLLIRAAAPTQVVIPYAGLLIGAATGVARVQDRAHTSIEVATGWVLGASIAAFFVYTIYRSQVQLKNPLLATISILLIASLMYGHRAPLQKLIDLYSPELCNSGFRV